MEGNRIKYKRRIYTIQIFYGGSMMEKKRSERDKRYEEKHKAERKAKCMVWGTSVPREKAEQINAFLKQYDYTKVQLIEAGYKALLDDAAEHNLGLAKIMDQYDDFFSHELEKFEKERMKRGKCDEERTRYSKR